MYMTLKLDDSRCCRIHSVSNDGNEEIVTNKRYVVRAVEDRYQT